MTPWSAFLCCSALALTAPKKKPEPGVMLAFPVKTSREAMQIAEQATAGQAVSARRIALNGATGGWAVEVHMPGETRGWRCLVDADSHAVFTRTRIPNPPPPKARP